MTHYKEIFKAKARAKTVTASDMLTYAIFKAMSAKGENKEEILNSIVSKSFTPGKICSHRWHPYQAVLQAAGHAHHKATYKWFPLTVFEDTPIEVLLPTTEEQAVFVEHAQNLRSYKGVS